MSATTELTSVTPAVLLAGHLKALKQPTFAHEYDKVAASAAYDRADYPRYLLRLCELERIDRERRMVERRIRQAKFPQVKSIDTLDFAAQPSLNKAPPGKPGYSNWRATNGSGDAAMSWPLGPRAQARPISPWRWALPPAKKATAWRSSQRQHWCMS